MIDDIKNIQSTKKDLRNFGLSVGGVLLFIGAILLLKSKPSAQYFVIISLVLILPGLFFPALLKPLQKIWMALAIVIGWISTRIILSLLFYFVLTPIGFIMRLKGKDILDEKIEKEKTSYWSYREPKAYSSLDSEQQF
ncbi:MAG: SxtJ family membrane protein [Bacteroidota bacterium]|nr:SxtJ family membrane protein [Bacteroidota bacterium]MDP4190983.1 SxtJ family membrane protein [Bacteroidota bacterium]MDP4195122.1 SxtJ family membrane protein [Bacteroidota bacterium]